MGYNLTVKQLKKWNVKYHKLIIGKPSYDLIIDDKAYGYDNKWTNKLLKLLKGKIIMKTKYITLIHFLKSLKKREKMEIK